MANIMNMRNVRNKVHRNGFDLSFRNTFTAKVGELLPVMVKEVLPGDKFDIDVSSFTRTQPVNSAAFSRLREYYDFYFVPYSLLWDKFESYIVQTKQPFHAKNFWRAADVDTQPFILSDDLYAIVGNVLAGAGATGANRYDNPLYFNEVGVSRAYGTMKLLSYLGYGDWFSNMDVGNSAGVTSMKLNPFPLLAYQKIYQDHFRNSQWEKAAPWTYNVDYMMYGGVDDNYNLFRAGLNGGEDGTPSSSTNATSYSNWFVDFYQSTGNVTANGAEAKYNFLDLRYANYRKDLFMGVLPSPQFGDTAIAAPISGTLTYSRSVSQPSEGQGYMFLNDEVTVTGSNDDLNGTYTNTAGVSVFALRQAEFLQKWKEITQSGSLDYREQLEKHWNVKTSPYQSYMSRWLGGTSGTITINEVVNQNLNDASSTANLFGKASGSVGGKRIKETFNEYGLVMCIYHCEPVLDWAHVGLDRVNTKVAASDYAIPEFDNLGMEALPVTDLLFSDGELSLETYSSSLKFPFLSMFSGFKPVGYVPRYIDYKTSYDQINGSFLTSMSHWVNPLTYDAIVKKFFVDIESVSDGNPWDKGTNVSYETFKVDPSVVDSIFAVAADDTVDTDCLLIGAFFDCKVVRNLSTDGLPY